MCLHASRIQPSRPHLAQSYMRCLCNVVQSSYTVLSNCAHNMQRLGKGLKDLPRAEFVLATKFGRYGPNLFDFSAERVRGEAWLCMQLSYKKLTAYRIIRWCVKQASKKSVRNINAACDSELYQRCHHCIFSICLPCQAGRCTQRSSHHVMLM